jgi:hypothetical protein
MIRFNKENKNMPEKEDYFKNVETIDPGKRKMDRLQVNSILKSISKKKSGYNLDWVSGKASFMKQYRTTDFPKWFAKYGDEVYLQVSIRLILGETPDEAKIKGLKGLEVYYRFLKMVANIDKSSEASGLEDEEKTEEEEFSIGKNIVETTDWVGTNLYTSQMAQMFYDLLESIGLDKVQNVMNRMTKKEI